MPVEQFGVEWAIRPARERLGQDLLRTHIGRLCASGLGLAQRQEVQEVLGRRRIDVPAMLLAAQIPDQDSRKPDDVQLPDLGILVIEPQQNEVLVDRCGDGRVGVDDAAQEFTADAVVLFDVEPGGACAQHGRAVLPRPSHAPGRGWLGQSSRSLELLIVALSVTDWCQRVTAATCAWNRSIYTLGVSPVALKFEFQINYYAIPVGVASWLSVQRST